MLSIIIKSSYSIFSGLVDVPGLIYIVLYGKTFNLPFWAKLILKFN